MTYQNLVNTDDRPYVVIVCKSIDTKPTAGARYVITDHGRAWIPEKYIGVIEWYADGAVIDLPRWLAESKGII